MEMKGRVLVLVLFCTKKFAKKTSSITKEVYQGRQSSKKSGLPSDISIFTIEWRMRHGKRVWNAFCEVS